MFDRRPRSDSRSARSTCCCQPVSNHCTMALETDFMFYRPTTQNQTTFPPNPANPQVSHPANCPQVTQPCASGHGNSVSRFEVSCSFLIILPLSQSSQSLSYDVLKKLILYFCRPNLPYRFGPPPNPTNTQAIQPTNGPLMTQPGAGGHGKCVSNLGVRSCSFTCLIILPFPQSSRSSSFHDFK